MPMTDGSDGRRQTPGAAYVMLALELASLADLRDWPPVGALAQTVLEAAGGSGGVSLDEAARIRAWADRWSCVRPEIRRFYAAAHADPSVAHCLRRLLDGGPEPHGRQLGALREAWCDREGGDPPFPLWWRVRVT